MYWDPTHSTPRPGDVIPYDDGDPRDGVACFDGGFCKPFRDPNEYLSICAFFIPTIDDLICHGRNVTLGVSGLVGCVFNSRKARKYRQLADRAIDRIAQRIDPRGWIDFYSPEDPAADAAADPNNRSIAEAGRRAQYSAYRTTGLV